MILASALASLLTVAPNAYAQTFVSPGVYPSDVSAAIAAASPPTCSTAPLPDALSAMVGVGTPCLKRPDDVRPTQVQPVRTTTAADGTFSVTWPSSTLFTTAPTYAHAEILGGSSPYQCDILTVSTSTVTGKCYMLAATTLPGLATSLLNLVVSPFVTPGAGMTVMIIGRQ